jgi:hypothetical protein
MNSRLYVSLRVPQFGFGGQSIGWIDQHDNANGLRHQLMRTPNRLAVSSWQKKFIPVALPPGPGEARDQAKLDRVVGDAEDDRDRRGRSLGRDRSVDGGVLR